MSFDPMTGEPIENNNENNMQFDPMTGEPIMQQAQPTGGFDPMTGEPVMQQAQPAGGFDPMTGEPIMQQAQPAGGFDPMTGEPIMQQAQPAGGFDPMTGKPIENKKKTKLPLIIGIVAAVVAVVAFAGVLLRSGILMGEAGRVMAAITNTFEDVPHFVEALEGLDVLNGSEYTVEAAAKIEGVKVKGELRVADKKKQVYGLVDGDDKLDILVGLDSKSLFVQSNEISDRVFLYHYTENNTGFLMDEVDEDAVETMNSILESIARSNSDVKKVSKECRQVFVKEFKSLSFSSVEKERYTINEKDVNCKGYTTTITGENMVHIVDGIEAVILEYYDTLYDNRLIQTDRLTKEIDTLRDELEGMDDIKVTFYLYKNQLAAINLRSGAWNEKIELCFEGGDYRIQNMELKTGPTRIQIKGTDDGKKESFSVRRKYNGNRYDIASLEYNYGNNKFTAASGGNFVSGKLVKTSSLLSIQIDEIRADYFRATPDLELRFMKGAKFDKYNKKEFDLGNASKDDFEDISADFMDELRDNDSYYLLDRIF